MAFPALAELEPEVRASLAKTARIIETPVATIGYSEGMPCKAYVLRLAGGSHGYIKCPAAGARFCSIASRRVKPAC